MKIYVILFRYNKNNPWQLRCIGGGYWKDVVWSFTSRRSAEHEAYEIRQYMGKGLVKIKTINISIESQA